LLKNVSFQKLSEFLKRYSFQSLEITANPFFITASLGYFVMFEESKRIFLIL